MRKVKIYDTTLRDGAQAEGISFSLEDKLKITRALDELGIHYIEGGWPGSNPKDIAFFKEVKKLKLKTAKIAAFGSTRRKGIKAKDDQNLKTLIDSRTPVVTIFGKSWDLHVKDVLRTSLEENLEMIFDSVKYLKAHGKEVIYDAEHFFDGYKANADYAIETLLKAIESGADNLSLCDTNGGTLPWEIRDIIKKIKTKLPANFPLGMHAHNDAGFGVANTVEAVRGGVELVQGTINGYGERCGNANLCSVIPNLQLKLHLRCLSGENLKNLTRVAHYIDEMANVVPNTRQPYVGNSAFAHKGGIHVSAVEKTPRSYEHISPEQVGNRRRILVSELSGKSNILWKAKEFKLDLAEKPEETKKLVGLIKQLEHEGYQFEGAEGSFDLLIKKSLGKHKKFFDLAGFRVSVEKREDGKLISEATIKVKVKGKFEHTAAEGDGPVNALDNALRKALEKFYPQLKEMSLTDFKVRIINPAAGTKAKTRVLIESGDRKDRWSTVGVSENIIEASWQALVDSIEYKLLKE